MINQSIYLVSYIDMIIYLLLVFTNEKRAQIYSYPNIENKQTKLLTEFTYQKLYKLHNYKFNKPNMIPQRDRFLFRISDKTYIHIGKNVFTFNSDSEKTKYKADIRNDNDFELPYAYDDKFLYNLVDYKYTPIEKYKKSKQKNEYDYFYNSKRIPGKKLLNLKFLDK